MYPTPKKTRVIFMAFWAILSEYLLYPNILLTNIVSTKISDPKSLSNANIRYYVVEQLLSRW